METQLGLELKNMYDNAQKGERVMQIHLFGIKNADIIKENNLSVTEIVKNSGILDKYTNEVRKGMKLAKHVKLK